jgi:effector-binding domain-containing protein
MKVLKVVGIILVALVAIVVVLGLIAPKNYRIDRSVTIDSPKALVFRHVQFWRNWGDWSPWAERDSTMQVSVEGADGGEGAIYKWTGDKKLSGKGEMINTGVKPNEQIDYHLNFLEPWPIEADGDVEVADADGGTKVTWSFYGEMSFPWNVTMLFVSRDKMAGKDLERGLERLKNLCQQEAQAIKSYHVRKIRFPAKSFAAIRKEISITNVSEFYSQSLGKIMQEMGKKSAKMAGIPCGLYYTWDEQNHVTDMAAAVPVNKSITSGDIKTIKLAAATAYAVDYYGPYEKIIPAHLAINMYLEKNGLTFKPPVIEEYVTDPLTQPDNSKWLTRIYYFTE